MKNYKAYISSVSLSSEGMAKGQPLKRQSIHYAHTVIKTLHVLCLTVLVDWVSVTP